MICCEGYKMFRGTMRVTPTFPGREPFDLTGDWLYKPEHDTWYGCGQSFGAAICKVIVDKTEDID